jgi:hypothetical protein
VNRLSQFEIQLKNIIYNNIMSQSKEVTKEFGSITVLSGIKNRSARLTEVGTPLLANDAATKGYVDAAVNTITQTSYSAGTGLTLTSNIFSVNASQTQITQVGNISNGTWSGNVVGVPYGGTGVSSIPVDKIIIGNGAGPINTVSSVYYTNSTFTSESKISIRDTSPVNATTASLTISGGMYIDKNAIINSELTCGSLYVNGTTNSAQISGSSGNLLNLNVTNTTTTNLNASDSSFINCTSTNLNTQLVKLVGEFYQSSGNLNLSGNINATSASSVLRLGGNANFNGSVFITSGSISIGGNANITSGAVFAGSVNVSGGNVNVSSGNVTVRSGGMHMSNSNLLVTSGNIGIINGNVNLSSGSLSVSTGNISILSGNLNVSSGNVSILSGNLNVTNGSVNVSTSGSINGNIVSINSSITNAIIVNSSISNLIISTMLNSPKSNLGPSTCGTLFASGLSSLTGIVNNGTISTSSVVTPLATIGNLYIDYSTIGVAIFTLSSTGNLYSTNATVTSLNVDSSTIGILNVTNLISGETSQGSTNAVSISSGNSWFVSSSIGVINSTQATVGALYTQNEICDNLSGTNLTISNLLNTSASMTNLIVTSLTSASLRVTGSSTQGAISATSISTGNIRNLSTITTNTSIGNASISNLISLENSFTNITTSTLRFTTCTGTNIVITNSTNTNMIVTNASCSNLVNTNCTIGNALVKTRVLFEDIPFVSTSHGMTSGSRLTILPTTLTDNSSTGSTIPLWASLFLSEPTLIGTNTITTERATNLHISGAPLEGVNNTISFPSALSIGYVPNQIGSKLSSQITFERSDNEVYAGVYTEDSTNRLTIVNASISGGGGLGLYVSENSGINMSTIPSRNDITQTPFAQFKRDSCTFYSTQANTINVTSGGIYTQTLSVRPQTFDVTEGSSLVLGDSACISILKTGGVTLSNLIVTMPVSSINGKMLYLSTTNDITNITISNLATNVNTLTQSNPKTFVYVATDSLWYSI